MYNYVVLDSISFGERVRQVLCNYYSFFNDILKYVKRILLLTSVGHMEKLHLMYF